ncbi:MAG: response regulator transcription factor [Candidatus Atribacteria bacterium]|nr:response regulator transcription factor [Candidatus Atribacteria bacterium]
MKYIIYLVEDEENLNQLLTSYLKNEGWEVHSFFNGSEAQKRINAKPHLWILDIMLPDIDGYQLIREIKTFSPEIPVIFISARDADLDRIVGLEMGSDDYLPKPFLPRELVIRSRKILERTYEKSRDTKSENYIQLPPYIINTITRSVHKENQFIELTSKEFDLLCIFAENPGKALTREQIIEKVWGNDYYGTDRAVDDLLRRLRKKIPEIRIETLYGFGYRLVSL